MKPTRLLIPLLLLAASLSACSSKPGGPSEADARAALEQQIQAFSKGCIKLVRFDTDKDQNMDLGNVLLVKATAEIEFLEDCNWPIETTVLALKTTGREVPNVRKGERRTIYLTLQFHRTKTGWKATQ
jgi:hypothetical protein